MDEKRMKIVEIGGAQQLLNMLESARDDRTRKESLKALFAISKSENPRLLYVIVRLLKKNFNIYQEAALRSVD